MNLATHTRPLSYLKTHTPEVLNDVAAGDPLLITENGRVRLVVMDVRDYEQREQTLALLKILAMGDREIKEGRVHDFESVFIELEGMDEEVAP